MTKIQKLMTILMIESHKSENLSFSVERGGLIGVYFWYQGDIKQSWYLYPQSTEKDFFSAIIETRKFEKAFSSLGEGDE